MTIPEELRQEARWVCFNENKLPIAPATGGPASSTDPRTWTTYQQAAEAVPRLGCRGVGFVLGDGWAGIDIDHCIGPDGQAAPEALTIINAMNTYTEYSPSGTGIHILWRGRKPGKACRRALPGGIGLEMYDGGRYFTITGRGWHDPPLPLAERSPQAAAIYRRFLERPDPVPAAPPPPAAALPDDDALIALAHKAANGDKFAALWAGRYGPYAASHSEADLALCNMLAFWAGCNKARMDALFRRSALYRPKWDQRRGADTYGSQTLDKAIAGCCEVYDPARPASKNPAEPLPEEAAFLAAMAPQGAAAQPEGGGAEAPQAAQPPAHRKYSLDDTGNAQRFRDLYGNRVRYNFTQNAWFVWDGKRWARDDTSLVKQMADAMLDGMEKQLFGMRDQTLAAAMRRFITKSRGSNAKKNLLTEAQHLAGIPTVDADYDRDRSLLNLPNGILRLSDGTLLPHDRDKLMTRMAGAAFDAAARAPVWEKFIAQTTGGDKELARYLQVLVGYMLSGSVKEQSLNFLWGDGSNGKSTFLNVLAELLGSYAMHAESETIASRHVREGPRTDIARLKGARLVIISECPSDVYLDEATVKQLTGGDTVTARHLYGREFEYKVEYKIIMATNHKPRIRGTDTGIWRRVRLVPFTNSIPPERQDFELPAKLRAELPGILNWAIEGLRLWLRISKNGKRSGMPACAAVDSATAAYRGEQDRLKAFLEECVEPADQYTIQASALYQVYRRWCEENGERYPLTGTKFGREISKTLQKRTERCWTAYLNVRLTAEGERLGSCFPGDKVGQRKQPEATATYRQLRM